MKKKLITVIITLMILVVTGIITNYVDGGRVATGHEPKYCLKLTNEKEHKISYIGLGYKVIRYTKDSVEEPYEDNIGVKMGNWFMKYELPIDSEYNEKEDKTIHNLDDFYNTEVTKDNDIRDLSETYNSFDAEKDNCFVIGAMVHNDYLYNEFMENYENKNTSFIRVAQNTIEGDLLLLDILYYKNQDKLFLVRDYTRDKFGSNKEKEIELKEYEGIKKYEHNKHLYWILYNGEVNEETFDSENVFVITLIN